MSDDEQSDEHGHDHADGGGHEHADDDGHDHQHHQHDAHHLGVAVVTVSSSRTFDDDPSGDRIASILSDEGHEVVVRELIADEYDSVQGTVDRLTERDDVDLVVTTGGTGVTPDDVTVEAVEPLLDRELPGFGELFRRLSYEEIGSRSIATRTMAGIVEGVLVCCLPGSEAAVRLGVAEIIVPEAPHLVGLSRRED
ncbi:MogA/MoaB family molybdenum cofactor biosynthesis protein [Haloarchaeobius salinus]|uniref:MogA/MoaB family molybdenum cofactor biosynthesis protein n=1 Tax=Haloarchaeobius salinus TaxID=1198298 RepID=UPI00210A7F57|nr:MogA/MoaB family molybdenum cofactor biosynthesis protein [Haloarchaeobius salinus]